MTCTPTIPRYTLHHGDCLDVLRTLPDASVDAVVTDPPYAEVKRPYGKLTETQWHALMNAVVVECRRILKPHGSAVFVLQPNSERVGRMRPWLFEFMAKWTREWNMVQDAWWWNPKTIPSGGCSEKTGLMRPSLKACVRLGNPDGYRNQNAVLWGESQAMKALRAASRCNVRRIKPSGHSVNDDKFAETVERRGGVTPFNLLPIAPSSHKDSSQFGHSAGTPYDLADWWIRYICKPGGVVLDPFAGMGTIGVAAINRQCGYIGIEQHAEYIEIARARIAAVTPTETT